MGDAEQIYSCMRFEVGWIEAPVTGMAAALGAAAADALVVVAPLAAAAAALRAANMLFASRSYHTGNADACVSQFGIGTSHHTTTHFHTAAAFSLTANACNCSK
jgi:hypothetical protein